MMHIIADDEKGPKWIINELFGRKEELRTLYEIAAEKTSSVVLVEGAEGTGKTTLIQQRDWGQNDWVFVSSKFDRSLMAEPYSALKGALDHLVELWAENNKNSPGQINNFQKMLQQDMHLLPSVIPGISTIVENYSSGDWVSRKHHSIKDLTRSHAYHNEENAAADSGAIAAAFLRFFSFLSSTRPIVLFLDDVHYADASSMEILEVIAGMAASSPIRYRSQLLLAMSYRKDLLEKNKFALKTITSI